MANKMLCRLCLIESDDILEIFNQKEEIIEQEVLKVVDKHLQVKICYEDVVSNIICLTCWDYLQEFHKFWLSINDKQRNLNSHLVEFVDIKSEGEEAVQDAAKTEKQPVLEKVVIEFCPTPELDYIEEDVDKVETELVASTDEQEEDDSTLEHDSMIMEYLTDEVDENDIVTKNAERENQDTKHGENNTSATKEERQTAKTKQNEATEADVEVKITQITKITKRGPGRPKLHENIIEERCSENPDFFKCSICNKLWLKRVSYINHMIKQHPAGVNLKYKCPHCKKRFAQHALLVEHKRIRHKSVKPTCKICNKTLYSTTGLKQHEKSMHRNEIEGICEICGKIYRTPKALQYHMDYTHNTEPHPQVQCTICDKWFKSKASLTKHMEHHRDVASGTVFKCTQCDVEKSTRKDLKSHIRYHHSNIIYSCTMCTKTFKSKTILKEHEATHTGDYLYECKLCSTSFRAHSTLSKHRLRHHPNEWGPKNLEPNEYTKSVLNQARKTKRNR